MARQKVPVRTQAKSKPAPDGASDRRATKKPLFSHGGH
jgi:hypothetical protein